MLFSRKLSEESKLILFVTLGSMIEWYEVFLYLYWIPILSAEFLDFTLPYAELVHYGLILLVGIVARPLGGLLFGYLGDTLGRAFAFKISVILITVPSIAILFLGFNSWSYFAIFWLGFMRFLQGIPAGGELPGALCLLYEGAEPEKKRSVCSYLFVGPQIGQILGMLQCTFLAFILTSDQLINWGWKVSFASTGIIGLIGFCFRRKLHESSSFEILKSSHKIEHHPFKMSVKYHKKDMLIGFLLPIFEVIGFFIIYFYLFQHADSLFGFTILKTTLIYLLFLTVLTISMPLLGRFGDRINVNSTLIRSALGIMLLTPLLFYSMMLQSGFWVFTFLSLITFLFIFQFSLVPSLLAELFPNKVRFTCLGLSFNIADGVIGGFTPFLASGIVRLTGFPESFVLFFLPAAVIFLISLRMLKNKIKININ